MIKTKALFVPFMAVTSYDASKIKKFNVAMFCLLAVVCFGCLVVANNLSIKGFQISEAQSQLETLRNNNERLQLSMNEIKSLPSTNNSVAALGMIPAGDVQYLSAKATEVSLAK